MRGRTGELGRNTGADSPTKRAVTRERAGQGCTGGPRASVAAKSLKPQWFPGVPQVVNMARVARSQTLGTSGPHSLVPLAPGPLVRFASPKVAFQSSADKLLRILEKQFMSHLLLEAPGATQTRAGAGTPKPTANPSQGPTAGLEWSQGERRPMLGTEGRVG